MKSLSIIIPAHNEAHNLRPVLQEIISICEKLDGFRFQVVVVDDHSSDGSFEEVAGMEDPRIACIRLSRRSGSHVALRAGLNAVDGDVAICISADGQDDPKCFIKMLSKWEEGAHIVWALTKSRDNEPRLYRWAAKTFYRVLLKSATRGVPADIDYSRANLFLMDEKVVAAVNACQERNTSLFGLLAWLGFKQDFVEYTRRPRLSGASKWTVKSRLRLAVDWIVAFSGLPLKLMSYTGIAVVLVGLLYGSVIFVLALMGNPVQGWASTVLIVIFLGGTQILLLSLIGHYLWRNLDESQRRPLFFIEKAIPSRHESRDE
jgi:dolichol-phosphate mannosyltransferase